MAARNRRGPGVPSADLPRRHLFISYTRADRGWVDRLQRMMAPLLRDSRQELKLWDDSQIEPGAKWRQTIEMALQQAQVALLLVSDAFLASEFVMNEEVPKLLAAAEAEGVRILWVSLSPCLVEYTPIHAYQAVLPLDHYLEELSPPQQQRALKRIAETIRDALREPVPQPEIDPEPVAAPEPEPRQVQVEAVAREQELEQELGAGVSLRLIQVPAGQFLMGSPADEPQRSEDEGPQHRVRLPGFLMAQTPITQAQWRQVASWQEREAERWGREINPTPSRFSVQADSDNRPVEQVSWPDAMEFCNRLSQRTGRHYTLPSEAQWEYACRAGSTTPFAFGATLSAELANYDATFTYGNGPKGEYRKQTTPVGMFPANVWGLHDMHGNVYQWCLDHWHDSYEGAPSDGSAWLKPSASDEERRLLRGGSWDDLPWNCRSAFRFHLQPVVAYYVVGFRVVCLPQGPSLSP
jgi:formylglycine-generating enzyme required for sulfatase activity